MVTSRRNERTPAPWLRIAVDAAAKVSVGGESSGVFGHQVPAEQHDRPAGVYAEWAWDGHELRVRNDRFGMGQLLYGLLPDNGGIALSPHLEHLLELGVATDLDNGAISVLIRLGFMLGCDTPFNSVRALPPNATLRWKPGQLSVEGRPVVPAERSIDRADAVAGYIDLFRQSMKRRPLAEGRNVLPLTGGQDSRHILFELCHNQSPPDLCATVRTHPDASYDDATVASRLAQALSIPHQTIVPKHSAVQEDFRKYRRIGVMSDEGGWTSIMRDRIRQFDGAYDGIGGDMLSSGYLAGIKYDKTINDIVENRNWRALAERIVNHFSATEEALAPFLLRTSYTDLGREYVLDRIVEQLEQFNGTGHPLAMFIIHNRTRREIAMMSWLLCAEIPTYYAPYLDYELFDFLAALPARDFAQGQWYHGEVIGHAYPQWSALSYLDKSRMDARRISLRSVVGSMLELRAWARENTPNMTRAISRWGIQRLATRAGPSTAPRRVVQHALVLEELLRRWQ